MPDLTIRSFSWSDVPAIAAIYRYYVAETVITFETEAPSEAAMADRFGKMVDLGHPVLVGEADGQVVGYAYASFFRPRAAYRFSCEDSIYLHRDFIGRGFGGQLLDRLIEEARAAGFTQMIAAITGERENSIRLHQNHGFRPVGRYEQVGFKLERWLDVMLMQRAL
jgi:L-amino acid N-acyltransferase YncA